METSTLETSGLKKQTKVSLGQVSRIVLLLALLGGIAWVVYARGEELAFALFHPTIVREVRMVYEAEHAEADKNVINRQRYEFISPMPTDSGKK